MQKTSVLRVVIPARYGSSRLPGKPLVNLAGKPMVVRVYEAVRVALPDASIVVATDDDRVLDVLARASIPAAMTSPRHASGTDRAAELARYQGWREDDVVVNVQGDEPLVPTAMLRAFAAFCRSQSSFSMATIATAIRSAKEVQDPNIVKLTLNVHGDAIVFSRAPVPFHRDLPIEEWPPGAYLRHIGVYAYRNAVLQLLAATPPCAQEEAEKLEQLRALWLGTPIHVMRWHQPPPHGVDTPDDAERVSAILKDLYNECD